MNSALLNEVLEKIRRVRIAIIGDFCLDAYWFVDESASEISIETGEPTRPVSGQKYSLGGAGNVANNLAAMEVKDIKVFGVIGNDPFGNEMISVMRKAGINSENLLVQSENWSTHVYIKPYISDKELSRIDFGNFNRLSEAIAGRLLEQLEVQLPDTHIVIINQQVPSGIHTDYFRSKLIDLIGRFPDTLFITDSRNYSDIFRGSLRKMNNIEAARLCGISKEPDDTVADKEIHEIAKKLYERYRKPLFITRGRRGSLTVDEKGLSEIPGLMIIRRVDTVGAGDSYLAGAAATLAAGYDPVTAATIGSFVAGVTVQKLFQTGTATPSEITEIGKDPDYIYNPALAGDQRYSKFLEGTDIEIINHNKSDLQIRYAIFDNDGTISTLREGWEKIMEPVMIKAILGENYGSVDETVYKNVKDRVAGFIDKTTGIQTLMQMKILLDLIREFGFVPKEKMLDEFGYKELYNNELMRMVTQREEKLLKGELTIEDFTIKNSIPFLEELYKSGIKLYLTSGTDEADVKHEASALGYDHLFEGRIFGAVGDINKEAKKIILDRILDSIGTSEAGRIVTFGDGPVEIRETRKRGGISVGVVSNELRRHGLNEVKRTRVIMAGADYVIPDFSQYYHLLTLLRIK
jgi:rfaE bifunctional protein kinase chain/domain